MINPFPPVSEEELHAYVDNELPPDRREQVTQWLSDHPEHAALVAAWQVQAENIRAHFGTPSAEEIPQRLKIDNVMRAIRGNTRSWMAVAAAAMIIAFFGGGTAGWMARGVSAATPTPFETFTAEALDAYRLYVVEVRHPVEVPGSDVNHMTQWLSKRLGYKQPVPDLRSLGLKLVGGRLLPGPTGAAAFYMYESPSGERFTVYCSKASAPPTALRYKNDGHIAAFYWVDDSHAYVVSGPSRLDELEKISKVVYEQLDQATDARKSDIYQ
jgi:anti-sigma factor RsiW